MNRTQVLQEIIIPTLDGIGAGGRNAASLVLVTGEVESAYTYIRQLGWGPAKSFWQVEPATHHDVVDNYLSYRPWLAKSIKETTGVNPYDKDDTQLVYNLSYACAIARMLYYRQPFILPRWNDMGGQWKVYKRYYNTWKGDTTFEEYEDAFNNVIKYMS